MHVPERLGRWALEENLSLHSDAKGLKSTKVARRGILALLSVRRDS